MIVMPSVAIGALGKNNRKAPSDRIRIIFSTYDLRDGKETIL